MIFSEDTLRRRDYRLLYEDAEGRAMGCGRDENGQFIEKNLCQADGVGGGASVAPKPTSSDSWDQSDGRVREWSQDDLKQSSPIKGGEKVKSLTIKEPKGVSSAMRDIGIQSLDDLVAIGGGPVRESSILVEGYEDGITVGVSAPVDPSDPSSPSASSVVIVMPGWGDEGGPVVDYSNFTPGGNISDASTQEGGENNSKRLRVASILNQRMLESLEAAERSGAAKAVTMAAGSKGDSRSKGYRLWPQFGFDAKLTRRLLESLPDEIALKAAGIAIPPPGSSRLPHATVLKALRAQVREVTIQQLMQFREGENWWTENGKTMEMTLDLKDKQSLGYKRYAKKRAKLPRSRIRNESRSCDGSDKDESGQFTTGNDCGGSGSGSAPRPPSRAKREQWRKSEDGYIDFDASQMKQGSSPLIGGEQVKALSIERPKRVAESLDAIGVKDLDTAVKIGGGPIRGSEIRVKGHGDSVVVYISSPIDPDNPDGGDVSTNVDISDYGDGLEVHYGGLNTPSRVSNPTRLEAGARDKTRLRVASLMQERMIESLLAAQKAGAVRASTYAVGDSEDGYYQGYRLWPQFGFDAKLDLTEHQIPPEIILASFKKPVPSSPGEAAKQAKKLTAKGFTIQQLISTREGKKWWDDNGRSIDLAIDLKDKKSLGYKRLAKLKKILPKLKDRNVAEGRTLLGWIIEEVSRRSMSLMGFLGGLGRAIERRDCGPSDKEADGTFAPGNDCQEDAGQGGDSVATIARKAKERDVDVMIGGKPRVAVMDAEARARAVEDYKANPKPAGSAAGSSTDLWDREMVSRAPGKVQKKTGNVSEGKIASTDPVFSEDDLRQNGQFVAHEAVGLYLSNRHEEERRKTGATGPASIIDLGVEDLPEAQMQYLVDALTEDAIHAYDVLGVDPGFYSTDLADTMRQMTQRYPEFEADENARFIFTTLLAITSTGQGPDANLRDADDLYRMFREHGTVVPTEYGGGARDATASLRMFQGLLDSFGKERTRRLLSGYTTAGKIEKAFEALAGKSQTEEWRQRTGASAWSLPVQKGGGDRKMVSGERVDEVVPVAAILGPKIGSFFANLSGRHEFLTMDRWLMRSVGRVTGDLVTRVKPQQAKDRATAILEALESGKWSREKLFGVDKTHGITKAALVRSLKIQARTGVIEENGAAYIWATAAERAYGKTPRPRPDGSKPGGYGKHPDPEIAKLHSTGNSMFKSLVHEQQDPGSGTARRNIREAFRRVQAEIEKKTGRKADIDEIQAALWQYEKRLWKHLGAKTNITDNSLFSAAAAGVLDGRLARGEDKPNAKPFKPASRRDAAPEPRNDDVEGDDFDTNHFDAEQTTWDSDLADLNIDLLEVLKLLEEDVEERRNFAALDAVIEERSADCGRVEGGRFGPKNQCQEDAGQSGGEDRPAIQSVSGNTVSSGSQWRKVKEATRFSGSEIPTKSLSRAESVDIIDGKLLSGSLKKVGVSLDDAAKVCAANLPGARVSIVHGNVKDFVEWSDDPANHPDPKPTVTFMSNVPVSGIEGAAQVGVSLTNEDGSLFLDYGLLKVSDEGKKAAPLALAREMMRSVANSIAEAERIGVSAVYMQAAGSADDDEFKGYRIWPRMGFDGVIPRDIVTPTWSLQTGFFNRYGSSIPDKILSPRARKEKASGELTIQALYETKEGQEWWEKNGRGMEMSMTIGDDESIGWQRFGKMRSRLTGRDGDERDLLDWLDAEWRGFREDVEIRSADCGRDDGGKFGDGNTCATAGVSNSKGESFRGVRRKTDKTQTKVARKLYQMRVPEKNLKSLVRDLGGKVSNTFVEIESTRDEEGVNVFVRDRDNNETHYIHVGYYGATVYTTDTVSSQEVSRIHSAVKAAMPKTIDDRLWSGGSEYPVYVVNDPKKAEEAWGGLSAKQRLKKERRSADCGRDEGGRFGPKNQCQEDARQGDEQPKPKSSPLDTNENKTWTPADGDEPFEGASRFSEVRASGGKKVAESLEKTGVSPGAALDAAGAPDGADIWMRPAPEFASQFDSPPVMVNFEADVAGVDRGLSGSSVIGSVNGEPVIYHSVFDASPSVQSDPAKRHIAARAFYRTMVASIEAARKNGIAEIKFSAAGVSSEKSPSAFRGYTIWPRMGFDAKLPDRIRAKLPESLSHATSLLDLHATREGTKWWAENGEDIDVSFRVGDRSSPQSKIMDRFIQHFMKERREMPLGTGDDWLSPEDLLRLDEMWQEVWDEGDLDDYEYVEQRSADCGRTEDGRFGPKNECQEEGTGGSSEPKNMLQASTRKEAAAYASMLPGDAEEDISKAAKKTRGPDRFGVVGSAARNIPVGDAKATKDYSESTIREVGGFQAKFAEDVAKRLSQTVLDAESSRFPGMAARAARDNAAAAVASIISAAEEMPEIRSERLKASTAEEIAQMFSADDPSTDIEIHRRQASGVGALYSTQDDAITFNTDGASQMIASLIANDSARKGSKGFSTSQVGHALVHEVGHRIHLQAIRKSLGIPINTRATDEQMAEITFDLNSRIAQAQAYIMSRPETVQDIRNLSLYAATSPMETVAEYYVGVKIGKIKRTESLDRVVEILGFPVGELSPAKKQRARKS